MDMNSNKGLFGGHHLGGDSCPPISFEVVPYHKITAIWGQQKNGAENSIPRLKGVDAFRKQNRKTTSRLKRSREKAIRVASLPEGGDFHHGHVEGNVAPVAGALLPLKTSARRRVMFWYLMASKACVVFFLKGTPLV